MIGNSYNIIGYTNNYWKSSVSINVIFIWGTATVGKWGTATTQNWG